MLQCLSHSRHHPHFLAGDILDRIAALSSMDAKLVCDDALLGLATDPPAQVTVWLHEEEIAGRQHEVQLPGSKVVPRWQLPVPFKIRHACKPGQGQKRQRNHEGRKRLWRCGVRSLGRGGAAQHEREPQWSDLASENAVKHSRRAEDRGHPRICAPHAPSTDLNPSAGHCGMHEELMPNRMLSMYFVLAVLFALLIKHVTPNPVSQGFELVNMTESMRQTPVACSIVSRSRSFGHWLR